MNLTPAQLSTLKTNIAANAATVPWNGSTLAINQLPNNDDAHDAIAKWYNLDAAGPWVVWRDLPMATVQSLITWASMTPLDAVPTTPALTVQVWQARSQSAQGKQMNLLNMLVERTTAPMKQTAYRAGLQDCLTNLPCGASGALIAANWTGVRDAAKFNATNAEKLFSTGTGSSGTPADLSATAEGQLTGTEVGNARNLP